MLATAHSRLTTRLANAPRGEFWIYFSASLFFNIGFSIFFFLFNVYLVGRGHTERSLGLIGSCMAAGSLCGTLPVGIFAERIGVRLTLTCGIALAVAASALRVCIVGEPAELAFAALGGMALSTWAVCLGPTIASLTTEAQRPFAFSLMFASGIGDAGLGSLAAGQLPRWFAHATRGAMLTPMQSERAVLLFACALAALATIPISRLTLRPGPAPRRGFALPPTTFLLRFLPAVGVWAFVAGAFPPFANVYFTHHLGWSLETMGTVSSLSQLAQFVAILAAPLLLRRLSLTNGVMLTQLFTAAALFSLAGAHGLRPTAWIYTIYMAAQYSNEPGIFSLLMIRVPAADRASASSLTFFISAGASILASTAVGTAIVRFGYPAVLYGIGALAVVAAALFRRMGDDGAITLPAYRNVERTY